MSTDVEAYIGLGANLGDAVLELPGLRVPHPRLHERAFVVVPLAEIAPELRIPGQGDIAALLASMATADIEALG